MDAGRLWIKFNRLAERGHCLFCFPLIVRRATKVVVSVAEFRVERNGLSQSGARLVQLILMEQCLAEDGVGLGIVGGDSDGLPAAGDGFLQLFLGDQDRAQAAAVPDVIWIESRGL